ncbi:MAG: hypothetical protein KGL12_13130 [Rhodospirillales bacterium]|nr:hypothetical protein [Rhodospirillales bacterium]
MYRDVDRRAPPDPPVAELARKKPPNAAARGGWNDGGKDGNRRKASGRNSPVDAPYLADGVTIVKNYFLIFTNQRTLVFNGTPQSIDFTSA